MNWLSTLRGWQFIVSDISIATAASDATESDVDLDARMASVGCWTLGPRRIRKRGLRTTSFDGLLC